MGSRVVMSRFTSIPTSAVPRQTSVPVWALKSYSCHSAIGADRYPFWKARIRFLSVTRYSTRSSASVFTVSTGSAGSPVFGST